MTGAQQALHLDTSFLIRALVPDSNESRALEGWILKGRTVCMSTLAWGEFLCGPLGEEEQALAARIVRRHEPMGVSKATDAARLFNASGRRRGSFADCVVAATAMLRGARLATADRTDFARFAPYGLEFAE